jgi:autotransporter adhesin
MGVGLGGYNGSEALSIGYSRRISDKANVTFGGAISGNQTSAGVGVGFGW